MADYPSLTLPEFMVRVPIQMVTRQRLWGGPYLTLGRFISVLAITYENFALIGRAYRKDIDPLIALVTEPWADRAAFLSSMREGAVERLDQYRALQGEEPPDLYRLIQVTEYAKAGVNLPKQGYEFTKQVFREIERASKVKCPLRDGGNLSLLVNATGSEAVGFGVRYPEKTWRMAEAFRRPIDPNEWEKAYQAGVVDSTNHNIDSVEEAERSAIDSVRDYVKQHRPDLAGSI